MKRLKKKVWFWLSLAILLDLVGVVAVFFMVYHIVLMDLSWFVKLILPAAGMVLYVFFTSLEEHFKFYKDCFSGASASENK